MYLHKLLEVAARVFLGNISERHLDDFLDFFFLTAKVSVNWSIHKISWGLAICVCEEASHNTFELSGHRLLTGRCPRRDWPEDLSCRLFILSPSRRSKQISDSLITCALAALALFSMKLHHNQASSPHKGKLYHSKMDDELCVIKLEV